MDISLTDKTNNVEKNNFKSEENLINNNLENSEKSNKKISLKRKRKYIAEDDYDEFNCVGNPIVDIFLKIFYPLSLGMEKFLMIGVFKNLDFKPAIVLTHGGKCVQFNEQGWQSFNKNINLIQCYLTNKVYGKKTSISLEESNIEVDNIKIKSAQGIRFRDLTKYDSKVSLNANEFSVLIATVPAINRYLEQLTLCGPVIKDYLVNTISEKPHMQQIYGPLDTSIYNRLPQEVDIYRSFHILNKDSDQEEEEERE